MEWQVLRARLLFTPREWSVLKLFVQGYTAPQIAVELQISRRTAEYYIRTIYEKLYVDGRKEVVKWAIQAGLIDLHWE